MPRVVAMGGPLRALMGVGIYVSSPAFFTDLSDGYRLGRSGRVRGDLGGVYFNAVFAVAVFPFYLITGSTTLALGDCGHDLRDFRANDALRALRWLLGSLGPGRRAGSLRLHGLRVSPRPGVRIPSLPVDHVVAPDRHGLERGTVIVLPLAIVFFLFALPAVLVVSWRSIFNHVSVLSHGGGAATVAVAVLGIAFTCVIMFAMTYGAVYLTRRIVGMAEQRTSGPAHSTGGIRRIRRLARTSLVHCRSRHSCGLVRRSRSYSLINQRDETQTINGGRNMKGFVGKTAISSCVVVGPIVGISATTADATPVWGGAYAVAYPWWHTNAEWTNLQIAQAFGSEQPGQQGRGRVGSRMPRLQRPGRQRPG